MKGRDERLMRSLGCWADHWRPLLLRGGRCWLTPGVSLLVFRPDLRITRRGTHPV